MSQQNALTVLILVAGAVIPYLLSQSDVTIAPVWKVVLTAANLALVALSRLSNPNATAQAVTITEPVQVTPVDPPKPEG